MGRVTILMVMMLMLFILYDDTNRVADAKFLDFLRPLSYRQPYETHPNHFGPQTSDGYALYGPERQQYQHHRQVAPQSKNGKERYYANGYLTQFLY